MVCFSSGENPVEIAKTRIAVGDFGLPIDRRILWIVDPWIRRLRRWRHCRSAQPTRQFLLRAGKFDMIGKYRAPPSTKIVATWARTAIAPVEPDRRGLQALLATAPDEFSNRTRLEVGRAINGDDALGCTRNLDLSPEMREVRIIEDFEQAVERIGEIGRHEGGEEFSARFPGAKSPNRSDACCHASSISAPSPAVQVNAKDA